MSLSLLFRSLTYTDKNCHLQFMQIFPRYSRMSPNHFFITFHNFWLLFFCQISHFYHPYVRMTNEFSFTHTHTHLDTEINSLPGWIHPKTSRSLLHAPSRFRWLVRSYCSPDTDGHWWTLFFFIYDFKRRSLTRTLPFGLGRVSAGVFDICFSSKKRSKFEFTSARL